MNLVACGFFGVFLQGVECPLPRFASLLEALCFEIGVPQVIEDNTIGFRVIGSFFEFFYSLLIIP